PFQTFYFLLLLFVPLLRNGGTSTERTETLIHIGVVSFSFHVPLNSVLSCIYTSTHYIYLSSCRAIFLISYGTAERVLCILSIPLVALGVRLVPFSFRFVPFVP